MEDHFIKIVKGKQDVIVVFSAVDSPEGKFHSVKALKECPATTIFVNCENNCWYLDGIPGLSGDYRIAAEQLFRLANSHLGHDGTILYYGGSMGGYGALLYGSLVNVDKILATGAELDLFKDCGYSTYKSKGLRRDPYLLRKPLGEYRGKCLLLYGELSDLDLINAKAMTRLFHDNKQSANCVVKTISSFGHRIPLYVVSIIDLADFLGRFLSTETSQFINSLAFDWGDTLDRPVEYETYGHYMHTPGIDFGIEDLKKVIVEQHLKSQTRPDHGLYDEMIGRILLRFNHYDIAREFLKAAVEKAGGNERLLYDLLNTDIRLGFLEEARSIAPHLARLHDPTMEKDYSNALNLISPSDPA